MNNPKQQNHYTIKSSEYQLVLPLDLGVRIPEDAPVRLLDSIVEEIDLSKLFSQYSYDGINIAIPPRRLFKIVVYAYMNGIYSSRKIEDACRSNINFMWLLGGARPPDHNTIARFRRDRLAPVMEELFYQLVKKLSEMGEIAFEHLFVDGTKIEANANKYSFVWKKAISKHAAKQEEKISKFLDYVTSVYGYIVKTARQALEELEKQAERDNLEFVCGKGKRKQQLQRDIEKLREYAGRQAKYEQYNAAFKGRNSFSKTDTDATFMHMKEDHMRNSQLKPGYNLQLGVEGEYIVGMDISSERSDVNTLIPFLKKMENHLGRKHETLTADAGYESEENYAYLEKSGQICFIKPSNYEQQKKRGYGKKKYIHENMPYDEACDHYICPAGKRLEASGTKLRRSKSGYEAEQTIYTCESCAGCEQKTLCTKAKENRSISVSKKFVKYRQASYENITSEMGILLRMNRSIQAEGAIGVIKQDYGFRRFVTRGWENVFTESLLMGFAYNTNKLHRKTQNNRLQQLLHAKMIS